MFIVPVAELLFFYVHLKHFSSLSFTLKAGDIEVRVINVGCAVKDILVPDKDGTVVDVNLGYSDLKGMHILFT